MNTKRAIYTISLAIAACAFLAGMYAYRLLEDVGFFRRPCGAEQLVGVPYISDGDTVEIAGQRVRLLGIDAPESAQLCLDKAGADWRCGVSVRETLVAFSAGRPWRCDLRSERDRYGRRLGTCFVRDDAGDVDVDHWMVARGWALSFRRYQPHPYDNDEDAAREAGLGLWSGAFHAPWDWRHHSCDTRILGAASVPLEGRDKLCR